MDPALRRRLDELYRAGRAYDAERPDRRHRLRNLESDTAALLALLVRAAACRAVLEIGTSNGYSTLWLADAVRSLGGRVVSVERDAARLAEARDNVAAAGLAPWVELREADAAEVLRAWPPGSLDLLFLDAERVEYAGYWDAVEAAVRPGGVLAVDNVLSHAAELAAVRARVEDDPAWSSTVVESGAGLLLAVRGVAPGAPRAAAPPPALRLEPLGPEHVPALERLITDPAVLRYTYVPEPPPPGFAADWVSRYRPGTGRFGFAALDAAGEFLGVGLVPELDEERGEAEIGYIVAPVARGRGTGTALLRAVTDWVLARGVARIRLAIDVDNPASLVVAERAGYRREGIMRSAYFKQGRRADLVLLSRLPSD